METNTNSEVQKRYLACERGFIFELLMLSAGMMGAYTFSLRGGIFCNAQTANFVMMAVAFGDGEISLGFYYLIPISAYLAGAIISEILPKPVKKIGLLRWDTYLIGFEIIVLFILGWLPLSLPDQIVQVSINFICSMQYNTFRQNEGVPMATTFCTNHLRQTGINLVAYIKKHDKENARRLKKHLTMLLVFFLGGIVLAFFCHIIVEKAIWLAMIPLGIAFIRLIYADLVEEKELLDKKPRGH
jgi:uncharacterized membrane protein YoaK (UPF0700 family)